MCRRRQSNDSMPCGKGLFRRRAPSLKRTGAWNADESRKFRIALLSVLCRSPTMMVPRPPSGRLFLLLAAWMLLVAEPATADLWYEHYSRAEEALEEQDWTLAVQEINEALERKGDSGARVRSYGMKVTAYFPYFKLGIAYYHLGQFDAALQAFETEARLGAIAEANTESAELERYRGLVHDAHATAAVEEQQRIVQIVEQSLSDARGLEGRGLLDEAMAALDQALAVAPDDVEAAEAMRQLRARVAEMELQQDDNRRVSELIENGRALLRERQYSEASSVFRQALFLKPSAEVQELLDAAQRDLLAELEASREIEEQRPTIDAGLEEVRTLESAGRLATALDRLQSVLVLDPANQEARSIQSRLLLARKEADAESTRLATIEQLLAEADTQFIAGSAEASLSAANRVLALDPGNGAALKFVAQAYGVISQKLLGTGPKGNIPPAVRFVDLRQEGDDGTLLQTIGTPDFRLDGVIIDNSPVEVVFYGDDVSVLDTRLNSQPLGEFYLTEFVVEARLSPGRATFRLVATDSEDLISSSEYVVTYARPFFRAPWFYAMLIGSAAVLSSALLWRRFRHREQLRKRRFNPYVAGAPVLDDSMFFGRHGLVDRILQTVHNNSLLIYGERRIGKTSIQHQLKKRLTRTRRPTLQILSCLCRLAGYAGDAIFPDDRRRHFSGAGTGAGWSDAGARLVWRIFLSRLRPRCARRSKDAQKAIKQKGQAGAANRRS